MRDYSRGRPKGWSWPAPTIWPIKIAWPPVWIKAHPATDQDIQAIITYQNRKRLFFTAKPPFYDKGTVCGTDDPAYETLRDAWRKG